MADKIFVFIPTFNCAPQIARVLAQFTAAHFARFAEVAIFDNRSTDATRAVAQAFIDDRKLPVRMHINAQNVNLGGTHKLAFKYAVDQGFDYCLVLHGDDQASLADFDEIFASGTYENYDYVLGSRFSRGSVRVGYSWIRVFGNLVFNALASLKTGHTVADFGGSGLNLFRVSALRDISLARIEGYADDLTFHPYLLLDALRFSQRINYVPISWREHDQKSNVRLLQQTRKLCQILLKLP